MSNRKTKNQGSDDLERAEMDTALTLMDAIRHRLVVWLIELNSTVCVLFEIQN